MLTGALAMIDILGFKQLTRVQKPEDVLTRMKALRDLVETKANPGLGYAGIWARPIAPYIHPEPYFAFLSDTIVAGLAYGDRADKWARQILVQLMARWVAVMNEAAITADPPFLFRGCIAFGEFMMDGNFILGAAVNEAAELHERAEAAMTWLTPTALRAVDGVAARDLVGWLVPTSVPLKGGAAFRTLAALPLDLGWTRSRDLASIRPRILDYFGSASIEIQLKRQHTQDFLDDVANVPMPEQDNYFPGTTADIPPSPAWLENMRLIEAEEAARRENVGKGPETW